MEARSRRWLDPQELQGRHLQALRGRVQVDHPQGQHILREALLGFVELSDYLADYAL